MDKMTIEIKFRNQAMIDDPINEVKRMINDALDGREAGAAIAEFVPWPPIVMRDTNGNSVGVIRFEDSSRYFENLEGEAVEIDGTSYRREHF